MNAFPGEASKISKIDLACLHGSFNIHNVFLTNELILRNVKTHILVFISKGSY